MKKSKKLILLFFVMLVSSVYSAEINASKEIPANLNWSFSVELNPTNEFTKTFIYFDEMLIITAYNDKQPVIEEDFVLKAFMFDKNPEENSGLTVFASYFGIPEGKHTIKIKTFNQSSLVEEKEFEVKAINTITAIQNMPDSFKEDVDILMKSIIKKINEGRQELEQLKNSTEQNVEQKTSSLEKEINELEETLSKLNELKEEEIPAQETEKKSEEILQDSQKKQNYLTGFYNFSVDNAWKGAVFLIALLVLLALLYQMHKMKSNQTVFEEVLDDKDLEKEFEDESSLEGFAEEEPKPKKRRFSISDLIQKK